jgi:hypothetical protein
MCFEISRARLIGGTARMLPTIDLDDDPEPMTGKIGEVRTDRRLATKVVLLEWRLAQMLPEFLFGCGGVATQRAGARHAVF